MKISYACTEIKRRGFTTKPLTVYIYPTNACSCKCTMCDVWKAKDKSYLTIKSMMDTIDECNLMNVDSVVLVGGGEPSIHPQLNLLFDYTEQVYSAKMHENISSVKIGMMTNGVSSFDYKKYIQNLSVKYIRFSIDSLNPKTYKSIRHSDLKKPLKNFINCAKVAPDKTRINCVVTNQNYKELKDIIDFVDSMDSTVFFILDYRLKDSKEIIDELKKYSGYKVDSHNIQDITYAQQTLLNKNECVVPYVYCVINSSGDVYPCVVAADLYNTNKDKNVKILGNIYKDSLNYIWKARDRKFWVNCTYDICKRCSNGGIQECSLYIDYRNEYEEFKQKGNIFL